MKRRLWDFFIMAGVVALLYPTPTAIAQEEEAVEPSVDAVYRGGDVHLDGRVEEAVWREAQPATRFVQGEPVEGAPAEEKTEVRILFDEKALYVSAVMSDRQAALIGNQLVRRDEQGAYDYFELSLDPNNDRRTGYSFRVSAAGVQRDVYLYDDTREDEAWDAVWQSSVHRDSTGWSVEMRIPLSQLRYDPTESIQSWGVNFSRRRLATNERTYFALESRVRHGKVSVFGRLNGLSFPGSPRRIEFRPYALSRARSAPAEEGNPFFDGSDVESQIGLDFRYGLGASHTLDVTVNPDFGQVEVDPAVINLSAFETFFPEKRPFFVEDAQIFDFSLSGRTNRLFYSRRIGRKPQGSSPSGNDFEDIPTETTILSAAKLTGRTLGGLSMGALAAVTARETGRAYGAEDGTTVKFPVEPQSQYGVVRVQQDFRDGASQIGAIATAMRRDLPRDGRFDFLTSNAYSAGFDFEHNWGGSRSRDWAVWGFVAGSYIQGSEEALLRVQRSSIHYFQRPDAMRFSVDSTATSMTGLNWRIQFERRSAQHWTGGIWLGQVTPGFEINDMGFTRSGERLDAGARLSYQEITPGTVLRSYRFSFFTFHNWRHEALDDALSLSSWNRAHKRGVFSLSANLTFLNYWGTELSARYSPQSFSDTATRGGPLMVDPASTTFRLRANTDRRRAFAVEPSMEYENRHRGGYQWRTELELSLRPAPSWEIELQPSFSSELEPAQYVTAVTDDAFTSTFGRRYIFSDLKRRSFSVETRINVAFSPKLSLQLYAQPLISAGNYRSYKQLLRAESFDFDVFEEGVALPGTEEVACMDGRICLSEGERYVDADGDGTTDFSFSDRDFNIRSLRMNAVLRWEYRPGSTLFLVWQQG
ncbi:MAG: DUF5916 domain-containing protein, partial [Rhodothermales bacterium]